MNNRQTELAGSLLCLVLEIGLLCALGPGRMVNISGEENGLYQLKCRAVPNTILDRMCNIIMKA